MVKLVTVIETQACRACRRSGKTPVGSECPECYGTGNVEMAVLR